MDLSIHSYMFFLRNEQKIRTICISVILLLIPLASFSLNDATLQQEKKISLAKADTFYNRGMDFLIGNATDSAYIYFNKAKNLYRQNGLNEKVFSCIEAIGDIYFNSGRLVKAITQYEEAYEYALQNNKTNKCIELLKIIGSTYKLTGDYENAMRTFQQALEMLQQSDSLILKADLFNTIGHFYITIKDERSAKKFFKDALAIFKEKNDTTNLIKTFRSIGQAFELINDYDSSSWYYQQGLNLARQSINYEKMAEMLENLGKNQLYQKKFDRALFYFRKVVDLRKTFKFKQPLAYAYNYMGEVYLKKGNYQTAIDYFNKAIEIQEKHGVLYGLILFNVNLAEAYSRKGNPVTANRYLLNALAISKESNFNITILEVYKLLSDNYRVLNDHKTALIYLEEYLKMQDSIYSKELQQAVTNAKIKYETEKRDRIINELKLKEKENQLRQKNNIIILFIIIIFVMLVLAVTIFLFYRQRNRYAKSLEKEIEERKLLEKDIIRARNKAQESDRVKTSLLANMSHEFRTPLNGILGFAEIIKNDSESKDIKESSGYIIESGERLMNTINSIMLLSQLESGISEENIKRINFNVCELLSDLAEKYKAEAKNRKLNLQLHTEKVPQINADKNLINLALSNIIENALKFTNKGSVEIDCRNMMKEKKVSIAIKDTGIGIDRKHLSTIFKEFRQGSEGYGRQYEGSGLGLSISKKIITLFGGKIYAQSESGKGTTFTIHLPASDNPKITSEDKKDVQPVTRKKPLILIVEDNKANVHLIYHLLKDKCELDHAFNGTEAMEKARDQQYDLFLIDINLGEGPDGIETTRTIKKMKKYQKTPFVAITGYTMIGDEEKIKSRGLNDYLGKPFTKKQLVSLIKKYCNPH